jgi:hypothetical protein
MGARMCNYWHVRPPLTYNIDWTDVSSFIVYNDGVNFHAFVTSSGITRTDLAVQTAFQTRSRSVRTNRNLYQAGQSI